MVHSSTSFTSFQQQIHIIDDAASGARGVIAIHSTTLGPAAGGCRFWSYADSAELATDAVRLARGMSYKNALAGLPFGGGKAVLQRPAGDFDRQALFRAFADAVEQLQGLYVTAEDVGTSVADMRIVREKTRYVAGLDASPGMAGGDPSPWTSLGVFLSMREAARLSLGTELRDLTVAVQGVGNVGAGLCALLAKAGAKLIVADVDPGRVEAMVRRYGALSMPVDQIVGARADIFAPCALGAVINATSLERIEAKLVCGGANNQLATEQDGYQLQQRGIVYAPDYLVNAGGIINVAAEYLGETTEQVRERVERIPERLRTVLLTAAQKDQPTHEVADAMAETIIACRKVEVA